jgi:hypothetical protein
MTSRFPPTRPQAQRDGNEKLVHRLVDLEQPVLMGASAMWIVAPVRDEKVAELAPRFQSAVNKHSARPDLQAAWRAWCEDPDLLPGRFPDPQPGHPMRVSPLPAVAAFDALATDLPWDDPEAPHLDLWAGDLYDNSVEPVCVLVRKGSPVAALFHGIGPARAQMLPGWLGNFLLASDEVRRLRPRVEQAMTLPAEEEARMLQRVRDWLNEMGDSGDEHAGELLTGPLRCWRAAAEAGLGLCASQTWV